MKLRRNEMELRRNFSFPHWKNQDLHGGIVRFPSYGLQQAHPTRCLTLEQTAVSEREKQVALGKAVG